MIGRRVSISVDTSGCFARRSQNHQAPSTTTPNAAQPSVAGDVQPHELPWVIASSTVDRPAARPTAPSQSMVPVELRGRAGTMNTTIAMTTTREARRQPEDAVISGVAAHQQADHHESGAAAEAQAFPTAPTSPSPSGPRAAPRAGSRCRSGRARTTPPAAHGRRSAAPATRWWRRAPSRPARPRARSAARASCCAGRPAGRSAGWRRPRREDWR